MKIRKDTLKGLLLTVGLIVAIGVAGFLVGSWILAPKNTISHNDLSYKPRVSYPTENITLTYWRTVDGKEVFEPILEEWRKQHPNVTINVVNFPFADYDKRLSEAASAGTLPDLYMLRADWVPRYRSNLKPSPKAVFTIEDYKKTFAPITYQDLLRGDDVLAVSYGIPTLGLFYNTELFDKAGVKDVPSTWQELLDANSKVVQRSGNNLIQSGIALGTSKVANSSSILPLLMMQNGAVMTDNPPTMATFDKPDSTNYSSSAKALDFYTSFAKPSKSSYSWSDGFGESTQAFMQGRVGMIIDFPYKFLVINSQNPNLKYKMAKLPQVNTGSPINYSEYWAEGVSTTTKYPDVAWDFYNFMTGYEIMNKYSVPTMKPASRLDLAKAQEQDSVIGVFAGQVSSAKTYYKGNSSTSDAAILEMINTSLSGFDPSIAVRAANDKVTSAIKQYPY